MISVDRFGTLSDGRTAQRFTLENRAGLKVSFSDFGGLITSIMAPDRHGVFENVTLACKDLNDWQTNTPYLGALVGRVANRVSGAAFTLDGKTYRLPTNDKGRIHLHGGFKGFHKVLWKAEQVKLGGTDAVKLSYRSPDGEEGYPGNVDVVVQYLLDDAGDFKIEYEATCDRPTPVSLTQHVYFNLTAGKRDVMNHVLSIAGKRYTPLDADFFPTGQILPVAGTPYDFTVPKPVGRDAAKTPIDGYDLNYVLDRGNLPARAIQSCARLFDPDSGRVLETLTDMPGVQLYTGNNLDGTVVGPEGIAWQRHWGICFETQALPNAVNIPAFPSVILRPGEVYRHACVYRFSVT